MMLERFPSFPSFYYRAQALARFARLLEARFFIDEKTSYTRKHSLSTVEVLENIENELLYGLIFDENHWKDLEIFGHFNLEVSDYIFGDIVVDNTRCFFFS